LTFDTERRKRRRGGALLKFRKKGKGGGVHYLRSALARPGGRRGLGTVFVTVLTENGGGWGTFGRT